MDLIEAIRTLAEALDVDLHLLIGGGGTTPLALEEQAMSTILTELHPTTAMDAPLRAEVLDGFMGQYL